MIAQPKISVVLPVYNGAKYIAEAVHSVLRQTEKNFELLLIDDGSTDETVSIIKSIPDERIRLFEQKHFGLVTQLNFGIESARSEFIARMDADDMIAPERLENQLYFLLQNPEIGVVGSAFIDIDDSRNRYGVQRYPEHDKEIKDALPVYCPILHPSVMYRKSIIQSVNGYMENCFPAEDLDLWLRLYNITSFANMKEPLVFYRRHQHNSITMTKIEQTKKKHYQISLRFILHQLENESSIVEQNKWKMKLARTEYYYGSIVNARKILLGMSNATGFNVQRLRYLLPSLLGQKGFDFMRRNKMLQTFKSVVFGKPNLRKYTL